jgi:predicted ATPase/class 3 adenylate cyclase
MILAVRRDLPSGTVTFLFTDIEGSTKLLRQLGSEGYAEALSRHRRILREAFARHGGVEVDTQGDAFFVAFPTAPGAVQAAAEAQQALDDGPVRARIGLHTGTPHLTDEGYVGVDVHRAARIAASGHGGQVLLSASTASLVARERLRDLGEHRLKDLSGPERIYQLGDRDYPSLKTLYQTNLPVPAHPFLGRERELPEVLHLIERSDARLLTLTGPGGTGKTRLALQAAGAAAEAHPAGVWWVPLAPLRDPDLVLETAARVIGAKGDLAEHIADRSMLVVFDNFEQVVEAAAGVADLLSACPNLRVLVTSREPLHVSGEQEYPVPPLTPDEGVTFFMARARAVRPDFKGDVEVSEICRRLDDLPLALELAAARVKALSSRQLLERLDQRLPLLTGGARDLPERQRTLRTTIEWSYQLLDENEQRLFARLSVFRGGCSLQAAEEIAEASVDTMQSLLEKNLLLYRDNRFWMLETIRELATEGLERSGEADELRRRHGSFFLELAEEAASHDLRWRPGDWLDRLELEQDNLRAALDRFEESVQWDLALRLAAALWRFWQMRDQRQEGRRRLESALRGDLRPTKARASALNGAATLASETGEPAIARVHVREAFALHRSLGDDWGVALSTYSLAWISHEVGDLESARRLFEESERRFLELHDEDYALKASGVLAATYNDMGDRERARALNTDVLSRARALQNTEIEADTLGTLAEYALDEGQVEDAIALLKAALRIIRRGGHRQELAMDLRRFARAMASTGEPGIATMLLSRSEVLREQTGYVRRWFRALDEEELAPIRAQLDAASFAVAWEQGAKLTLDEAIQLALDS